MMWHGERLSMNFFSRLFNGKTKVYRQRKWTEEELVADGFLYYSPVKRVTMVRQLPKSESPKVIKTPWDTITATTGYYIAYVAGNKLKAKLDDYEPRPIEPHIFHQTYKPWDVQGQKPTRTEAHLLSLGCRPYYKTTGVWAKRLRESTYVQSIESAKASLAPAGAWLCVGTEGEPWTVTQDWFRARYLMPGRKTSKTLVKRA
jgi:hypothetical protein